MATAILQRLPFSSDCYCEEVDNACAVERTGEREEKHSEGD
jgi:hypothetical protein